MSVKIPEKNFHPGMKPIQNFRTRLNDYRIWVDGIEYHLEVPTGEKTLLWFNPKAIQTPYRVWIYFDWESGKLNCNRAKVTWDSTGRYLLVGGTSEFLYSDLIGNHIHKFGESSTFLQEFLNETIKWLSTHKVWWEANHTLNPF